LRNGPAGSQHSCAGAGTVDIARGTASNEARRTRAAVMIVRPSPRYRGADYRGQHGGRKARPNVDPYRSLMCRPSPGNVGPRIIASRDTSTRKPTPMKKFIIIALAASGAAVAQAQAETTGQSGGRGEFRAEMRALIAGDGMDVAALANLMQERATARFEALDADGDGIVTKDDVLAAAAERAQERFERMGPDEDGIVKREGRKGW